MMTTLTIDTTTIPASRSNLNSVTIWLRLEGLVMFLATIALYASLQFNGWIFLALLLTPDLSFIGYLRGTRVGAFAYNLLHNYALAVALVALAFFTNWTPGLMIGLIWVAHISMDRAVGYGLKYPTAFGDTHLGKVGR